MKTKTEIEKQIADLLKLREIIPEFSMFGDKNHEIIDDQVSVLRVALKCDEFTVKNLARSEEDSKKLDAYDWLIDGGDDLVCEEDLKAHCEEDK